MLCQSVSELIAKVPRDDNVDATVSVKCLILKQKLDALLATMNEEASIISTFATVSRSKSLDRI